MKAGELRIGNLVNQGKDYGIRYVTGYEIYNYAIFQLGVRGVADYYKEWQPIPLTEEWVQHYGLDESKTVGPLQLDRFNEEYWNCYLMNGVRKESLIKLIQYVHQLQNLYFALTGEELTLNQ